MKFFILDIKSFKENKLYDSRIPIEWIVKALESTRHKFNVNEMNYIFYDEKLICIDKKEIQNINKKIRCIIISEEEDFTIQLEEENLQKVFMLKEEKLQLKQ